MVLYCNGIETIIFTLWKFGSPRRNVWESTCYGHVTVILYIAEQYVCHAVCCYLSCHACL